ncbi:MAG: FkbM family methyltransferase [Pseudomonadota bacterium]
MTLSMQVGYSFVRPATVRNRLDRHLRSLRHGRLRVLRLLGARFVTSRYGVRMMANWDDRTFKLCAVGRYGRVLSDFIESIEEPFEFLDIGANQGLYTLIAGRNPACRAITAFEPVSRTHNFLLANVALNGLVGKVTPVKAAVSDVRGAANITLPCDHSGAASISQCTEGSETEAIALMDHTDLDRLLSAIGPKIVVKIDTEGHEPAVLRALEKSAAFSRIEAIFYEVDEAWIDAGAVRASLQNAGFTSFERAGSGRHYDVLARR